MTERDYAIKSFKEITLNARRHTESRMNEYYEKIKSLMGDYQELIMENQMVLEELEMECQEMINENMAYALQYMDAYDYRVSESLLYGTGSIAGISWFIGQRRIPFSKSESGIFLFVCNVI